MLYPSALEIAILARNIYITEGGCSADTAIPVYLRNNVAKKKSNIKGKINKEMKRCFAYSYSKSFKLKELQKVFM